jgi:hypothetical protein
MIKVQSNKLSGPQAKKWIWDAKGVKGYETQTQSRPDSVEMNMGKAERWGVPLVWIASTNEVPEEIRKFTNGVQERVPSV